MIKSLVILLIFSALAAATGQDETIGLEDRRSVDYPDCMEGTIYLGYDNKFRAKFGGDINSINKIKQIYAIAKDYLNGVTKRDLKTHFDFKMKGEPLHHDITINNVVTDINAWAKVIDGLPPNNAYYQSAFFHVLFTAKDDYNYPAGKAYKQGGLCHSAKSSRAMVVSYFHSDKTAAINLLKEIGHVMGIKEDWDERLGPEANQYRHRRIWNGHSWIDCTAQNGFMGKVTVYRNMWTLCSLDDFKAYYNNNKNNPGGFCLKQCETCFDKRPETCQYWSNLNLLTYFCLQTDWCQRRCAACRPIGWHHG